MNNQPIEIWRQTSRNGKYPHTDTVESYDGSYSEDDVDMIIEMNEDEYTRSLLANSSEVADYASWFGIAPEKKIKIVLLKIETGQEQ